jgi:hypothetical protein
MSLRTLSKALCCTCVGLVVAPIVFGHHEDCPRLALCNALRPEPAHGPENDRPTAPVQRVTETVETSASSNIPPGTKYSVLK